MASKFEKNLTTQSVEASEHKRTSPESPESLELQFEELLLSCERVNEGGKAIILKLPVENVRDELLPALETLNIPAGQTTEAAREGIDRGSKALKVFKIYLPNKGKHEYKMHQRAYEAVAEIPEEDQDKYAQVPGLSAIRQVTVNGAMKAKMEQRFHASFAGENVQLIAMEFIDGEDLATIFYKWILEHAHLRIPEETDAMNFKDLYEEIASTLHFESLPEGEITDPRALEIAEFKIQARNTEKIYDYLRKNEFPMPPKAILRIENTLNLLRRKNMVHGDSYERNVMLAGGSKLFREAKGEIDPETFLLDFGNTRDHFVEGVDDLAMVRRLKMLLLSPEEEARQERYKKFGDLESKAKLLRQNKKWQESFARLSDLAKTDPENGIRRAWMSTIGIDSALLENFFVFAKQLIIDHLVTQEDVARFTISKKDSLSLTPHQRRMMTDCLDWIDQF